MSETTQKEVVKSQESNDCVSKKLDMQLSETTKTMLPHELYII